MMTWTTLILCCAFIRRKLKGNKNNASVLSVFNSEVNLNLNLNCYMVSYCARCSIETTVGPIIDAEAPKSSVSFKLEASKDDGESGDESDTEARLLGIKKPGKFMFNAMVIIVTTQQVTSYVYEQTTRTVFIMNCTPSPLMISVCPSKRSLDQKA